MMLESTKVAVPAPAPKPVTKLVIDAGGTPFTVPIAPQSLRIRNLPYRWVTVDRYGSKPLNLWTGEQLLTLDLEFRVVGDSRWSSVLDQLQALRRIARPGSGADGGPKVQLQGFPDAQLAGNYEWRIQTLDVEVLDRNTQNQPVGLRVDMTLVEASDPVDPSGPVAGGKALSGFLTQQEAARLDAQKATDAAATAGAATTAWEEWAKQHPDAGAPASTTTVEPVAYVDPFKTMDLYWPDGESGAEFAARTCGAAGHWADIVHLNGDFADVQLSMFWKGHPGRLLKVHISWMINLDDYSKGPDTPQTTTGTDTAKTRAERDALLLTGKVPSAAIDLTGASWGGVKWQGTPWKIVCDILAIVDPRRTEPGYDSRDAITPLEWVWIKRDGQETGEQFAHRVCDTNATWTQIAQLNGMTGWLLDSVTTALKVYLYWLAGSH